MTQSYFALTLTEMRGKQGTHFIIFIHELIWLFSEPQNQISVMCMTFLHTAPSLNQHYGFPSVQLDPSDDDDDDEEEDNI